MTYRPVIGVPGGPGAVATDDSQDDRSIALLSATTADMSLYVDVVNGNDVNPGTLALPFKTITKALSVVPEEIEHIVAITLAAGTYPEIIEPWHRLCGGVFTIQGPMVIAAGEVNRLCDAGKASNKTVGTAGAGWVVNALQDKWVTLTAGTGAGQTAKIKTNTVDTITIAGTFNPVPNNTTYYEVRTPGAVITGTELRDYGPTTIKLTDKCGSDYRGMILYGLDLTAGRVSAYGCVGLYASGCAFRKGVWIIDCDSTTLGMRYYIDDAGSFFGDSHGLFVSDSATTKFEVAYRGQIRVFNAVVKCGISMVGMYPYFSDLTLIPGGLTSGMNFYDCSRLHNGSITGLLMDGTAGPGFYNTRLAIAGVVQNCTSGIALNDGSYLEASAALSGAANTGVAITATKNSYFNPNGQAITIAGTLGAYKAGSRPTGTNWADLATYGPDEDGSSQKSVGTVPGGGGVIALGRALDGMLASGLVICHDLTAGAVLTEVAPVPGGGQFSVNYGTGDVTFNVAQANHIIAIYYHPLTYTNARVG